MNMSESNALTPLSDADYGSIECAVMETERGRWFLSEYARRNRNTDTEAVLEAISKLENVVSGEGSKQGLDRIFYELMEMAKTISKTKSEISAIIPSENDLNQSALEEATSALDGIVQSTETATQAILGSSERIQETAWTLREQGANTELCDALDRHATDIYTACSFQDITSQRIVKVVHVIRYLEGRIHAMIDVWDHPHEGMDPPSSESSTSSSGRTKQGSSSASCSMQAPLLGGLSFANALSQLDVDDVIVDPEGMYNSEPVDLDKLKYVIEPSSEAVQHETLQHGALSLNLARVINEDIYPTQGETVEIEDLVHLQSFDEQEAEQEKLQENINVVLPDESAFFLEEASATAELPHSLNVPVRSEDLDFHTALPHAASPDNDDTSSKEPEGAYETFDLDAEENFSNNSISNRLRDPLDFTPVEVQPLSEDTLNDVSFGEDTAFNLDEVVATHSHEAQQSLSSMPAPVMPSSVFASLDEAEPFDIEAVETGFDVVAAAGKTIHVEQATQAEMDAFASDDMPLMTQDGVVHNTNIESDLDFASSSDDMAFDLDDQQVVLRQEASAEEALTQEEWAIDTAEVEAVEFSEPAEPVDPRKAAFAAIDQMDTAQKLSRFS
jgi:chemotaxis regulatin CheY-phosphate phosphatase CheZ